MTREMRVLWARVWVLLEFVFTLLVCGSRTKSVSGLSAGNFRLSAVA